MPTARSNYAFARPMSSSWFLVALLVCVAAWWCSCLPGPSLVRAEGAGEDAKGKANIRLQAYKSVFSSKRTQQIETANRILGLDNYSKQYKMVEMLMEAIFPLLNESRQKLEEAGLTPSAPYPSDEALMESLSNVYENIILLGDVVLRLPDITKKVYKRNKAKWRSLLQWGVAFCNESRQIYHGPHAHQLHLMAQEIGIIPEDPDYTNPFRKSRGNQEEEKTKKKRQKKKSKRGPKLSTSNTMRTEL